MVELDERKIWIDGCFDFAHHGHAGAMRQAKQHGDELYVGVHNDEEILLNKGPPVMTLQERMIAVEGCRWCTEAIADAPYVTSPQVMDKYGCKYVVHGDDISTDKDGNDCYAEMKNMGRFIVVKRTPNISTTDLVGRMLLCSKDHHMSTVDGNQWIQWASKRHGQNNDDDDDDDSSLDKKFLLTHNNVDKYREYATDIDAKSAGATVSVYDGTSIHEIVSGNTALEKKNIVYVDGGWDLFHPGHITFLKAVRAKTDNDTIVVVGIHDDASVQAAKGGNYPVMSIFERSLCVLQSKYINGIVLGAPGTITGKFLEQLGKLNDAKVIAVYHGPTETTNASHDAEVAALYQTLDGADVTAFKSTDAASIVDRVIAHRAAFEERQRRKGWKAKVEKDLEAQENGKYATNV